MINSLARFSDCESISALWKVIDSTCYRDRAESYDDDKHNDAQWADLVVRGMLLLWHNPNKPLEQTHLENYFNSYLWPQIIDTLLLSVRRITFEHPGRATARRINEDREASDIRARTRPRLDAVVKTFENGFDEFSGVEIARGYAGGETSTKWLSDSFKLAKVLADMLHCLHKRARHDEAVSKTLRVAGVICNGLKLQMMRMECHKGAIAILTKDEPIQVSFTVEGLENLFQIIAEVSRMKAVIAESVEAVRRCHRTANASHSNLL
jgi:hypothetical protein